MLKMRERVPNKLSSNQTAETDAWNKVTFGETSIIKIAKKYLLKRIAKSAYSFVLT